MPETRVAELLGDLQLDALISQRAEVQVLKGALWKDQGSERIKVVGPENFLFVIREAEGAIEITEPLGLNSHLSEDQRD